LLSEPFLEFRVRIGDIPSSDSVVVPWWDDSKDSVYRLQFVDDSKVAEFTTEFVGNMTRCRWLTVAL
jgi:hypothetical protein